MKSAYLIFDLAKVLITSCDKLSDLSYNTMHAIDQVDCAKKEQR